MKLGYKIKPRDAKSNPTTAILAAVFVMFLISGLLLLLLALLLYKMEPGESVIKIGIVAVYVISGLCGGFLMGKVESNKKQKKDALFNTAFELFTTKGTNKTTISDIADKAGVAKGTFYLYFKDKYDIKNKLIAHKTKELFDHAAIALEHSGITGLEDQLIFIIDDIINILVNNKPLLNFISKNLVMGALKSAFWAEDEGCLLYTSDAADE